jgi:EmrB/QacA subfamily drug resistance transporter
MKTINEKHTRTWVLVLASIGSFMVALDALIVSTALSTIRIHLGASIEELEWTVNAYTLTFAVLLMFGTALGDRFGRRRMFVSGLGLFVAASAACALAPNIDWLIAARAVQGCGATLVLPLAVTLLSAAFPPESRARAMGIFSSMAGLAVMSGPVVGGAISQGLSWQWIFWLNVPIGLILIPLVLMRIPESFGKRSALDIGGLLCVSGAALGITWGLVRSNSAGWASFEVIATLTAGLLFTVAFVLWELRVREPMLPMSLFHSRAFSAGNAAAFMLYASMYGSTFFLAQFMQTELGFKPLDTGVRLLPWTIALFVTAPTAGFLVNRLGERTLIVTGLFLQAIGMTWIGLIASPHLSYPTLVIPFIVMGIGAAMCLPPSQNVVISSVAVHEIGKASGTFNMLRQLAAAFGVAILAAVFAGIGSYHSVQAFSSGFTPTIYVSAAISLTGAIIALALPGKRAIASVQTRPKETETKGSEVYSALEQSVSL